MSSQFSNLLAISFPWPDEVVNSLPLFPGKLVLLALIVMSVVSWAIIVAKYLKLDLIIKSDAQFKSRLRKAQSCLELYEQEIAFQHSPLYHVYRAGAQSTALEMVGSHKPGFLAETQLVSEGSLDKFQLAKISDAFESGQRSGATLLEGGFKTLRMIALIAVITGLLTACWFMVMALNQFEEGFAQMLIFCMAILLASFCVTIPAGWFRSRLLNQYEARIDKMVKFRERLDDVFVSQLLQRPTPAVSSKPKPASLKAKPERRIPKLTISEPVSVVESEPRVESALPKPTIAFTKSKAEPKPNVSIPKPNIVFTNQNAENQPEPEAAPEPKLKLPELTQQKPRYHSLTSPKRLSDLESPPKSNDQEV